MSVDPEIELELLRTELETLYQVSQVLSRSLDLKDTLNNVLRVLHDSVGLERGMVCLTETESGELQVSAAHGLSAVITEDVRYRVGEGVVGMVLEEGEPIVLPRIADEPRFLGRLGIYEPEGALIGVPIRIARQTVGVFVAQPAAGAEILLDEYTHFLEMVANLIGQAVRLNQDVQREKASLTEQILLSEVLALRTLLLNTLFAIASGTILTEEDMNKLIDRVDREKLPKALALLEDRIKVGP
jgi:Nif-specific regulatory protein